MFGSRGPTSFARQLPEGGGGGKVVLGVQQVGGAGVIIVGRVAEVEAMTDQFTEARGATDL